MHKIQRNIMLDIRRSTLYQRILEQHFASDLGSNITPKILRALPLKILGQHIIPKILGATFSSEFGETHLTQDFKSNCPLKILLNILGAALRQRFWKQYSAGDTKRASFQHKTRCAPGSLYTHMIRCANTRPVVHTQDPLCTHMTRCAQDLFRKAMVCMQLREVEIQREFDTSKTMIAETH